MSIRNLPGLVALASLVLATQASAGFNSPTLLYETPTADVLPAGSFAISADMTLPLTQTSQNIGWWEADANLRFSPVRGLDFGVTAYTLEDYVLDAKYQLVGGGPGGLGVAVGVCDMGIHSYVSPIGHDSANAWPDWQYRVKGKYVRTTENFSAFVVTSIPLAGFARVHVGLGRGRFVGYDGPNEYMNTDILLKYYHDWAIALFGGFEVFITPNVALVAEAGSRDMNTGVKANFGPVTAELAWTKMEGLILAKGDDRFGRLEFGVSCQIDNLFRRREPECAPVEPIPPPELLPEPPVRDPRAGLRLSPIYFEWDKWDITPEAESTLRRNAEVIRAHPGFSVVITGRAAGEGAKVMITGHASEEGTDQHNQPLSERRAKAAYEYLKSLGVPPGQMSHRGLGEEPGSPLPLHRRCDFEIEPGK